MKKWFVIHPLLFALFPILFLFAHNTQEMALGETVRPLLIVIFFTGLLWLVLSLVIRNLPKAAIVTSIFLILFFSYGHLVNSVPTILRNVVYLHSFLFALVPIPTMLSLRIKEMPFGELVRAIVIVVCFSCLLWLLVSFVIKKRSESVLITVIVLLSILGLVYLVGPLSDAMIYMHLKERYLVLFWPLIFAGSTFLVIRTRRNFKSLTHYLNLVSIFLIAIPVVTLGVHKIGSKDYNILKEPIKAVPSEGSERYPDIYYIILDGYARADILQEYFQYDNSAFLKGLAQKGFYVAAKSRSNYIKTALSLASSLNLTYLDDLAEQMGPEAIDERPLLEMIRNSEVRKFLKNKGYSIVAFSTGVLEAAVGGNADIHMLPRWVLSEFENLLLGTTPLPLLLDELQYDSHRGRVLYVFGHLADMSESDTPLFVFAHILSPRPPFIFGEDGRKIKHEREFSFGDGAYLMPQDEYAKKYRNQLIFINKKIEAAVDEILSKSAHPPIIILQGDHGSGSMLDWANLENTNLKERLSIFNAYYLPEGGGEKLYPEITPVNTFRIIFNHYFGTDLQLLEDKCYFSSWRALYKFIDVTDEVCTD
jgi:hypothetical protein